MSTETTSQAVTATTIRDRSLAAGKLLVGGTLSVLAGAYLAGRTAATKAAPAASAESAASPAADDPLAAANTKIRDAGKWLIGSASAVGAILLAGSQLSSIGRLPVTWPNSIQAARLWVAVAGAALALVAVVYAIWSAVKLLLPVTVTMEELDAAWDDRSSDLRTAIAFFKDNPTYMQGLKNPADLISRRDSAVKKLPAADGNEADTDRLLGTISDLDARAEAIQAMAQHKLLAEQFQKELGKLLRAATVIAIGVMSFAWAANPPPAKAGSADLHGARLVDAQLRDADLKDATLDGADLTGTDFTGADLSGASLKNVTWSHTICPDGTNSDAAGNTCAGHLTKR